LDHSHRFPFAKPYRCRDCGGGEGVRSQRRTWMERYILPLFLMQPVRCADCFRRDYRLIFTLVCERLCDDDETVRHIHRNTARSTHSPALPGGAKGEGDSAGSVSGAASYSSFTKSNKLSIVFNPCACCRGDHERSLSRFA